MALLKEIETKYGIAANYHKISVTDVNWHAKSAHVEVIGFVDREAKESGMNPILKTNFDYSPDNFSLSPDSNIVACLYAAIKESDLFINAEDC
jgi:uncharacterized protein (UPF0210 family)